MGGIISKILDLEWEMFQKTRNIGGRASCQDDKRTFYLMRESQWSIFSKRALEQYYRDLCEAESQGRNMVSEKYGYMMESYDPEGFEEIKAMLPEKSVEERKLVEEIVALHLGWYEEVRARFPHFAARGRVLHSSEDRIGDVSIETYLRGELKTGSRAFLEICLSDFQQCKGEGRNLVEENYQAMAKAYGYEDLEDAEACIAASEAP